MFSKYGSCTRLFKIKNKSNKVGKNSLYFVGVFNKTVIPLALVGYGMIIAKSYPTCIRGIIVKYTVLTCGVSQLSRGKLVGKN